MGNNRQMSELEDIPLGDWSLEELAFQHGVMSKMAGFLNTEGAAMHTGIIKEIEKRGGLKGEQFYYYTF